MSPRSPRATGHFAILPEETIAIQFVFFFRCLLYLTSCVFGVLPSYMPTLPTHGILGGILIRKINSKKVKMRRRALFVSTFPLYKFYRLHLRINREIWETDS